MTGLLTDLYQLTMAAGYFEAGKSREIATFELFFRHLPRYRNYVLAAGLEQVVEYLTNLQLHRRRDPLSPRRCRSSGAFRRHFSMRCAICVSPAIFSPCRKARRFSPASRSSPFARR